MQTTHPPVHTTRTDTARCEQITISGHDEEFLKRKKKLKSGTHKLVQQQKDLHCIKNKVRYFNAQKKLLLKSWQPTMSQVGKT